MAGEKLGSPDDLIAPHQALEIGWLARLRDLLERNVFVIFGLAVCLTVQTQLVRDFVGGDSWYTLLGGKFVDRFGLPHHDSWTVMTLGREWIDQQWLAQLGFNGLWTAGGWSLGLLGVLALYLAAFAVLAVAARSLGVSDRAVAVSTLTCYLVGFDNSGFRAQIAAYPLFALVLALLVRDARAPTRRVYLVFPLLAVWANVHGSVVLGASLVALRGATAAGGGLRARAAVREWLPRAGGLLVLPWAFILVSPYGFELIHYYRSVLGNSELQSFISEWQPTTVRSDPVFFALLLVAVALVSRSGIATTWFERIALVGAGVLGMYASRYVVWFALVGAGVLPWAVDAVWNPPEAPRRVRFNVGLATACLVVALVAAATVVHGNLWFERDYPPRAEAAVAQAASADAKLRVFSNEQYADWLLFEDPQLEGRVAYDVRFELLTSAQLGALVGFRDQTGSDWQRAVRGYGLLVLNPASDGGSISYFEGQRRTRVLFANPYIVVLRLPQGTTT